MSNSVKNWHVVLSLSHVLRLHNLHCEFDRTRECHYGHDDLRGLLLMGLGTWTYVKDLDDKRKIA
jgi:hypothetical protein